MFDELTKLDIKTLNSFIAIAECQGVTAAQSRLNLSPSVISGHLSHLEDRLGMTLCQRGRAGFELTEDGAAVYKVCLDFQEDIANFQHQLHYIRQLDAVKGGHIRLCLADQLPKSFYRALQHCLSESYTNYPLIHFSLDVQSPEHMLESLLNNESDIGVGFFANFPPALTFKPAFIERQVVCCGHHHPLYEDSESLTVAKLEHHYAWVKRGYLVDHQLSPFRPSKLTATTYHMEATAQLILAGHHIGYLPYDLAKQYEQSGLIKILLPELASYEVQHYWAHRPNLGKPVAGFLTEMTQYMTRQLLSLRIDCP